MFGVLFVVPIHNLGQGCRLTFIPTLNLHREETKMALRLMREAPFQKLEELPGRVNEWVFTNPHLHKTIEDFAAAHCSATDFFQSKSCALHPKDLSATTNAQNSSDVEVEAPDCNSIDNAPVVVIQLHQKFSALFERELESFVAVQGITMQEFELVMPMAKEQEERDGRIFRWAEILSLQAFLVLMHKACEVQSADAHYDSTDGKRWSPQHNPRSSSSFPACRCMLKYVEGVTLSARAAYRRRVTILPMLAKWAPSNFREILEFLEASEREFPPDLDKQRLKNLLRWRAKLCQPVIGADGVYTTDYRNEAQWAEYLQIYTERMGEEKFTGFIALAEAFAASKSRGGSAHCAESVEQAKLRRAIWQYFEAIDYCHQSFTALVCFRRSIIGRFLAAVSESMVLLRTTSSTTLGVAVPFDKDGPTDESDGASLLPRDSGGEG